MLIVSCIQCGLRIDYSCLFLSGLPWNDEERGRGGDQNQNVLSRPSVKWYPYIYNTDP